MNTHQRIERVRELMELVDPLPFRRTKNSNLTDAHGNLVAQTVRFSDKVGVHPSNDHNAELIEHLTYLVQFVAGSVGDSVGWLQNEVHEQANRLFPNRTPNSAWVKLFEEIGEVIKDPTNPLEWGDVFIMLFDLSKMFGINIPDAVVDKMGINEKREWAVTASGTYQHTGGSDGYNEKND